MIAVSLEHIQAPGGGSVVYAPGWSFRIITVLTVTAGSMFVMWIGEQITERGIGNGISLIIMAGIVARLPSALSTTFQFVREGEMSIFVLIIILVIAIGVTAGIVFGFVKTRPELEEPDVQFHFAHASYGNAQKRDF